MEEVQNSYASPSSSAHAADMGRRSWPGIALAVLCGLGGFGWLGFAGLVLCFMLYFEFLRPGGMQIADLDGADYLVFLAMGISVLGALALLAAARAFLSNSWRRGTYAILLTLGLVICMFRVLALSGEFFD